MRYNHPQDLGHLYPSWPGFTARHGRIYTPRGLPMTHGQIRAIPHRRELMHELQRQLW